MAQVYKRISFITVLYILIFSTITTSQTTDSFPTTPLSSPFSLQFENDNVVLNSPGMNGIFEIKVNGDGRPVNFANGRGKLDLGEVDRKGKLIYLKSSKSQKLIHAAIDKDRSLRLRKIPLWLSIVPPLIAIILALILREVNVSLFAGIWSGAFIVGGMRLDSIWYFLLSIFEVIAKYAIEALQDSSHLSVLVFSLLIGGMVAIISKNGGMAGVVERLSRYAHDARSTQMVTWLLGVVIFFDDYANTLIVGNTMRSATDKFRISREKLAYIVDSTAAPVAAIAFITTWIGAELGYIAGGIKDIEGFAYDFSPYSMFVQSLKYSFYPILTLIFMVILIRRRRDFGPMYKAEVRARTTGQVSSALTPEEDEPNMEDLSPVKNAPLRWQNAAIPVLTVILVTILGLLVTGFESTAINILPAQEAVTAGWGTTWQALTAQEGNNAFIKLGIIIGNADSFKALLWSSLSGVVLAILLTRAGRIMDLKTTMHYMVTGFKTMMPALIILTLAWSLAITTGELHTADFVSAALNGTIHPYWLPVIVFVLAAFISFSTGSSWSTMAILYPIAIPTTWTICIANGMDPTLSLEILLNVIAVTLGASVMGDHCSPISDTTILSSLASDCNHIDHVRTQMPYALTVGIIAIIFTGLSTYLGGGWLISFIFILLGAVGFYFIIGKLGKTVN